MVPAVQHTRQCPVVGLWRDSPGLVQLELVGRGDRDDVLRHRNSVTLSQTRFDRDQVRWSRALVGHVLQNRELRHGKSHTPDRVVSAVPSSDLVTERVVDGVGEVEASQVVSPVLVVLRHEPDDLLDVLVGEGTLVLLTRPGKDQVGPEAFVAFQLSVALGELLRASRGQPVLLDGELVGRGLVVLPDPEAGEDEEQQDRQARAQGALGVVLVAPRPVASRAELRLDPLSHGGRDVVVVARATGGLGLQHVPGALGVGGEDRHALDQVALVVDEGRSGSRLAVREGELGATLVEGGTVREVVRAADEVLVDLEVRGQRAVLVVLDDLDKDDLEDRVARGGVGHVGLLLGRVVLGLGAVGRVVVVLVRLVRIHEILTLVALEGRCGRVSWDSRQSRGVLAGAVVLLAGGLSHVELAHVQLDIVVFVVATSEEACGGDLVLGLGVVLRGSFEVEVFVPVVIVEVVTPLFVVAGPGGLAGEHEVRVGLRSERVLVEGVRVFGEGDQVEELLDLPVTRAELATVGVHTEQLEAAGRGIGPRAERVLDQRLVAVDDVSSFVEFDSASLEHGLRVLSFGHFVLLLGLFVTDIHTDARPRLRTNGVFTSHSGRVCLFLFLQQGGIGFVSLLFQGWRLALGAHVPRNLTRVRFTGERFEVLIVRDNDLRLASAGVRVFFLLRDETGDCLVNGLRRAPEIEWFFNHTFVGGPADPGTRSTGVNPRCGEFFEDWAGALLEVSVPLVLRCSTFLLFDLFVETSLNGCRNLRVDRFVVFASRLEDCFALLGGHFFKRVLVLLFAEELV